MKINVLGLMLITSTAYAFNFPEQPIVPYSCGGICQTFEHNPLQYSWPADANLLAHKTQHEQTSFKYHMKVTTAELQEGISINTNASGALVRISRDNKAAIEELSQFYIFKNQRRIPLSSATSSENATTDEFSTTDAKNTLAFQFKKELGSGPFILANPNISTSDSDALYQVDVLDKNSTLGLTVKTDKTAYKTNDLLSVTYKLSDGKQNYPIESITASLQNGVDDPIPLHVVLDANNQYKTARTLNFPQNVRGDTWSVEVDISTHVGKQSIKRHAHTAFSYYFPSAIIEAIHLSDKPYQFKTNVNVATSSRYELQAVLFATDSNNNPVAIETSQSSTWLEPGPGEITISFTPEIANQYRPPYYLGFISLLDYAQLKTIFQYADRVNLSAIN